MTEFLIMALALVIPTLLFGIWIAMIRRKHPPSREAVEAAKVLFDFRWLPSWRAAVVSFLVYTAAYPARKYAALPGALEAVVVVAPVLAFAWFLHALLRELRSGDELERRIQGEAALIAFSMFLFWSIGIWIKDELSPGPRRGAFDAALGLLPFSYALGMFLARARYIPASRSKNESP